MTKALSKKSVERNKTNRDKKNFNQHSRGNLSLESESDLLTMHSTVGNRAVGRVMQEFQYFLTLVELMSNEDTRKEWEKLEKDVKAVFKGTFEEYLAARIEADQEWEAHPIIQKHVPDKAKYRWMRVRYKEKDIGDVPKFFGSLGTATLGKGKVLLQPEVAEAIEQVRQETEKSTAQSIAVPIGGFVPREAKPGGKPKPGKISEHAIGRAVDVDHLKNEVFSLKEWRVIEEVIGSSVDRSEARWWRDPIGLWFDIDSASKDFVRLGQQLLHQADQGNESALEQSMKWTEKLSRRVRTGFINLDPGLVEQFHAQGFLWGVTFQNPDIHHFEFPIKQRSYETQTTKEPQP
ncbi:hypothetical protein KJ068_06915 [bacterium]|nr:hypothetical protein [bacterium]